MHVCVYVYMCRSICVCICVCACVVSVSVHHDISDVYPWDVPIARDYAGIGRSALQMRTGTSATQFSNDMALF